MQNMLYIIQYYYFTDVVVVVFSVINFMVITASCTKSTTRCQNLNM